MRMTANKAIEIIKSKGYESTTPYISMEHAREIEREYKGNVHICYDEERKQGSIAFLNTKKAVMHYKIKCD